MSDKPKDECGLAVIYLKDKLKKYPTGGAAYYLYKMLLAQQNRGQLSAGISTYNPDRNQILDTYKKLGTVNEVFGFKVKEKADGVMKKYEGRKGIGHVRYATCGKDDVRYAHPFERHHGRIWKWFAFGFNGQMANYAEKRKELEKAKYHISLESDTEILMHLIAKQTIGEKKKDPVEIMKKMAPQIDGAYALNYINAEGTMFAARGPLGIKPLCYTDNSELTAAASETIALNKFTDEDKIKDIKPGEMLVIENGSVETERFAKSPRTAHCMFEWIYFANAASTIDGRSVYKVRRSLGEELAKLETLNVKSDSDYVVVPVPDTAKPSADAYGYALGLPVVEGLMRNRYVGRTFIETSNRYERVQEKYSIIKRVVEGKKVILVEDSIVRGTTSKALIKYVKEKGKAKEVHMRVSCPPIKGPCFYGIDMSTMDELIAPKYLKKEQLDNIGLEDVSKETVEKIRKEIGADSLIYQTIKGLVKAIDLPNKEKDLCMACINSDYPTPCGKKLFKKALQNMGKGKERTYESQVC